jgi:hypothetical protein
LCNGSYRNGSIRNSIGKLSYIRLSKEDLFRKINDIQQLCENIYNKYSKIGGEPYTLAKTFQLLKGKRMWPDALRLEACRAMISNFVGAGGDVIRMGANAVSEGQALAVKDALRQSQEFASGDKNLHAHITIIP